MGNYVSEIIEDGAREMRILLPGAAFGTFEAYCAALHDWSRKMNLTAVTGEIDTARLHFLDSLALLRIMDFTGARVIDVGSGAGFPGLPLLIAEPTIALTLLDATEKRVDFLRELCDTLLLNAECKYGRAEELSHESEMREQFDIVVSRAVAKLNVLCELCLPFVRIGGAFIAMKGADAAKESAESASAARALGAELEQCVEYTVPGVDAFRAAVIVRKVAPTPVEYPRRYAKIKRSPL